MGKKLKTGKQRKDKYYQLAKETGYRSRAAFKLIQLNRKFEFLQKSKVLIDLCAAPGGWLQVAQKYMPVSSVIVGVDLVPIKQIHNVITLQDDITTQHCRQQLKRELKTWKADVVLHDGAPNVGKSWLHDAFSQIRLTLSAVSLASEMLIRGGWFVTKVFRSKDYNALMWLLGKLFQKVHATKPQASRHESAEIFVVCQNYLAPDKIDPRFFDPSYIFDEVAATSIESEKQKKANLLKPVSKQKKQKAEGYEEGDYTLHHKLNASDFIQSNNHIELLGKVNEILIDTNEIKEHPATTNEVLECCKDIKVLGKKELLLLIGWRRKLKSDIYKSDLQSKEDNLDVDKSEKVEEVDEIDEVDMMVDEASREMKRKKRKILRERKKLDERMNLKMVLKNDQLVEEDDQELFQLKRIKNKQLKNIEEVDLSDLDIEENEESDDETFRLKSNAIFYEKEDKSYLRDDESDDQVEEEENDFNKDDEVEKIALIENETDDLSEDENELIVDLNKNEKRDKINMFYDNEIFKSDLNNDEDDDLELDLISKNIAKRNKTNQSNEKPKKVSFKVKESESSDSEDSDDSFDEAESQKPKAVDSKYAQKCKRSVKLDPEGLALGSLMVQSKKTKRDIIDNAWNRFTHGDHELLPSWFKLDEEKHFRKSLPVTQDMVKQYKDQLKEINAQPIKKVAEAKARKKKRAVRKLEKARRKAEMVCDANDMSEKEKAAHIRSVYKRGDKKETTYVVAKKHVGKKRPAGVKGKFKLVDPRMKKDKKKLKAQNNQKGKKQKQRYKNKNSKKSKKS